MVENVQLPVDLQAVADAMDMVGDEVTAYINRKTGEIVPITDEEIALSESDDDDLFIPEWQVEMIALAKEVMASEDFIALPDRFEIHEYSIMRRFCNGVADDRVHEALVSAISGRGAFRRFKDLVHREGIAEDWYAFRDAALCEIAADFLTDQGIPFAESRPPDDDPGTAAT